MRWRINRNVTFNKFAKVTPRWFVRKPQYNPWFDGLVVARGVEF